VKEIIEIEKLRLRREKAKILLDKSITLYFVFLLIGVLGFIYKYINQRTLDFIIISGFIILIFGTIPYIREICYEEKKLNELSKRK